MDPRYRDVKADQIPSVRLENGTEIKIICGQVGDTKGPVRDIIIDPEYLDITVPAQTAYSHPTKSGHTVFVYVIDGKGYFCKEREPLLSNENLVLFEDGDQIIVNTEDELTRFLLISGKPIREPVAWQGPIVMNTDEELRIAFDEYRQGTFVKQKKS